MYEEKKKRFFPPLTHLYLTETPPQPPNFDPPFAEQFHFPIQYPRRISILKPLSFVNVFISKRHLTLCTYPPVWNKGWLRGLRREGSGGRGSRGGWALYTAPNPPLARPALSSSFIIPTPHFTLLTGVLSPSCFLFSGASVKVGEGGGVGGKRVGKKGDFMFCLNFLFFFYTFDGDMRTKDKNNTI